VIAVHEAGHAVACLLTGSELHYATVVPDGIYGGHIQSATDVDGWHESPAWVSFGVTVAAGMVAEAVCDTFKYPNIDVDWMRETAVQGGGTGSRPVYDTGILRWIARAVWETAQEQPLAVLGPEFQPEWADNPDGVRDIAAYCWATAVRLLCANAGTLLHVARKLNRAGTLTGDQIASAAASRRHRRHQVDPDDVGTDFWLADYSRLVWRPYGMCRTRKAGAR
jgi:hypothetical protein